MKEVRNEQDLKRVMTRIITEVFPMAFRGSLNNVRSGVVKKVNTNSGTVDVLASGTNQIITNIKYHSGADNVQLNDFCFLISPDAKVTGQVKAIIFNTVNNLSNQDWWEEIGRTRLTSAGDTIEISGLPERRYLKILISLFPSGGTISTSLTFNSDTGTNYSAQRSTDFGAASDITSQTGLFVDTTLSNEARFSVIEVSNFENKVKLFLAKTMESGGADATTAPNNRRVNGKWSNSTDLISTITLSNTGTGSYDTGSELIVLGHN